MKTHNQMKSAEANEAAWEASKGAVVGAAKWGGAALILSGLGQRFSPLYRGLTIQFKIYLGMCGSVVGSMLEADHWLRQHEARIRMQNRIAQDRARWERYEEEFRENPNNGRS